MSNEPFQPGEAVIYRHAPGGGYFNVQFQIPAVVVRVTEKRVRIVLALRSGPVERSVKPENLRRKDARHV